MFQSDQSPDFPAGVIADLGIEPDRRVRICDQRTRGVTTRFRPLRRRGPSSRDGIVGRSRPRDTLPRPPSATKQLMETALTLPPAGKTTHP